MPVVADGPSHYFSPRFVFRFFLSCITILVRSLFRFRPSPLFRLAGSFNLVRRVPPLRSLRSQFPGIALDALPWWRFGSRIRAGSGTSPATTPSTTSSRSAPSASSASTNTESADPPTSTSTSTASQSTLPQTSVSPTSSASTASTSMDATGGTSSSASTDGGAPSATTTPSASSSATAASPTTSAGADPTTSSSDSGSTSSSGAESSSSSSSQGYNIQLHHNLRFNVIVLYIIIFGLLVANKLDIVRLFFIHHFRDVVLGRTNHLDRRADIDDQQQSSDTTIYTRTSTSQYTLTTSGTVVVVTSVITAVVTGSEPSSSGSGSRSLNGSASSGNSFFSNTGAVAGTFVVVGLAAAGIVIFLGFFFVRRKRARRLDEDIRVAAGGAGDGGAGVNRFNDDDEEDLFGAASEGHHSTGYMSSYGSVPLVSAAAAGGFAQRPLSGYDLSSVAGPVGAVGAGGARTSFEPGHSPSHSQGSIPLHQMPGFGSSPAAAGYNGYGTGNAQYGAGASRSHEGALHDDWAEYVDGVAGAGAWAGAGAARRGSSGEGSPGEHGSQEGMMGSGNSHSGHGHSPKFRDSGESYYAPTVHLSNGSHGDPDVAAFRNSLYGGLANEAGSPPPVPPKTTDDRLDPGAIDAEAASLADEHDYSRRILRVANPSDN
ncbi:hypothetical protein JCM5296_001476 [Sporobolomyces johnsonii]